MELTIDQALQKGVAAHKEGKLQDAERVYRAILQAQPNHPDANHNLGVLAVSVGKPLDAVPLFKLALEANPKVEQFWLSYIDALIKLERFDEAKRVLVEGEKSGVASKKLNTFNQRLEGGVPDDTNKAAKGQTLSEKRKKLAEKKKSKKRKAQGSSSSAAPSQDQINRLLEYYQVSRLDEAEALATSLIQQFPKHPFGWKVFGAVLQQTGRLAESLAPMQSAVMLSPQDAEAHNNLGVTRKELGRLDEAEASFRQARALKPDYAEAHNNLGSTLGDLVRLEEAEASCRQAIALKPDYAEAHYNLSVTLKELGRLDEAEASCRQAITLQPDFAEAHSLLGQLLLVRGKKPLALSALKVAQSIKPNLVRNNLLLRVIQSSALNKKDTEPLTNKIEANGSTNPPIFVHRAVESRLLDRIYEQTSRRLDSTRDSRFGSGTCSPDFNFLRDTNPVIQKLAADLKRIMEECVQSDIFIYDSFFNILGPGGGSAQHDHVDTFDRDYGIEDQKYSLVYYLSVGDQACAEPGLLKLYDPSQDILPTEGMIVIIPASRKHSAIYGGESDRVMVGVNFYAL